MNRNLPSLLTGLVIAGLTSGCVSNTDTPTAPRTLPFFTVTPRLETTPSSQLGADADDVAVWHNESNGSWLVVAAQKEGGYSVYDHYGNTLVDHNPGDVRYNNVDLVKDFPMGSRTIDLVAFTDRFSDNLSFYAVGPKAPYLEPLPNLTPERLFGGIQGADTAYGLDLFRDPEDGRVYAFATQADKAAVVQVELQPGPAGIGWEVVRRFELSAGRPVQHAEGLVVDPISRTLFMGQEEVGVYRFDLAQPVPVDKRVVLSGKDLLVRVGDYGIQADIEGLALADPGDGSGYLLMSSQGNNQFFAFEREGLKPVSVFKIVDTGRENLDGSEECDGIEVNLELSDERFPSGVLIVQDGFDQPTGKTNFKLVSWEDVRVQLDNFASDN